MRDKPRGSETKNQNAKTRCNRSAHTEYSRAFNKVVSGDCNYMLRDSLSSFIRLKKRIRGGLSLLQLFEIFLFFFILNGFHFEFFLISIKQKSAGIIHYVLFS